MQCPAKARGFTLIELMITVAVAIILAGIAMPSFRSMLASERMSSESFDVMAMLTLARSEAIKRNGPVTATPANGDWKQGWAITGTIPLPANCTPGSALAACGGGGTTTISSQSPLRGADISITCVQSATQVPCGAISYNASGRLTTGNAPSIQIVSTSLPASGGQNARCIKITLSGMPKSKKGKC